MQNKTRTGCKAGDTCLFLHCKIDEDKGVVAIAKSVSQLGCVSQDSDALVFQGTKEFRGDPMQKVLNAIRKVRFTKSTLCQASIREKIGPSLGKTKVVPRQRSPYAPKFEDRSHEEIGRQQRCAQSKAWDLAKNTYKLGENDKATFFSPTKKWALRSASSRESCRREFVVDAGASMHMVSEKNLNSAELAAMRTPRSPTTVMTANSEVRTNQEATKKVKQLDLFVKVMLLQETPAVLSLGKLCDERGYTYHWKSGQNQHLIKNGKRINCNIFNYVPCVVPGISASSSSTTPSSASSPSSSQESTSAIRDSVSENRDVEAPVFERRRGMNEELRRDPLHDSTETIKQNKNRESEEVQRDISHDLLDWLQEFRGEFD